MIQIISVTSVNNDSVILSKSLSKKRDAFDPDFDSTFLNIKNQVFLLFYFIVFFLVKNLNLFLQTLYLFQIIANPNIISGDWILS